MLYVGQFGTIFCYHTEDQDLFSINYHHSGSPKLWYVLPPQYAHQFELAVRTHLGDAVEH